MDAKPRLLRLHYRSRRALAADHAAYWVHGGMMVPASDGIAPPANSRIVLQITGPDGVSTRLPARVGRRAPGQGFLLSFEPEAEPARAALEAALDAPERVAARELEPAEAMIPPEVELLGEEAEADEDATDPALPRPDFGPSSAGAERPTASASPPRSTDREWGEPAGAEAEGGHPSTAKAPADAPSAPSDPASTTRPPRAGAPSARPPDDAARPPAAPPPSPDPDARRGRRASGIRGARPRAFSGRRPVPGPGQTVIRKPRPGERYLAVVVRYPTMASYLEDLEALETAARLEIPPPPETATRNAPVLAKLTLPGHNVIEIWSVVEEVTAAKVSLRLDPDDERYRRACLFPTTHQARNRQERETERGDPPGERSVLWLAEEMPEEAEKMPLRRRIKRMGMEDKINLALSGNREERMALAQDSNRSIHHHLLRNAKLTIDEVAYMSRLPSLNPDVLDKIAENPGYTQNPAVTKALVFNPRTPLRTALRLLDRLPRSELNVLSRRTGMNKRLVMAAKNKLGGGKW